MNLHPRLLAFEAGLAPSPVVTIDDPELAGFGVELSIKRDDLLHAVVSGNKWRKLKYILDHALTIGADTLVSMGGSHSNHLHALAYVGRCLGLKTAAFVRGEPPQILCPTLRDVVAFGMTLHFVSREHYRALRQYRAHDALPGLQAGQYWVPEGGALPLALNGVGDMAVDIEGRADVVALACGTATTLAGLVAALDERTRVIGIAALKGAAFLNQDVERLLAGHGRPQPEWRIALDYHHGGFGKTSLPLRHFIDHFQQAHSIPLDAVYTGKALYAVYDLIRRRCFAPGQRILVIHTGGLQGTRTV
ncbi:MAG: pyridoxal-phosphate dependent enzyme [Methylomonas sp.]|nr:pyridoxal-phosphate dependent enzyme [Methylomonas sp.]PPD20890.1 MAG: 1-aminocyclopropane-1-carboxylate deaminase [Methylomonas sp.]PPD25609.1 MAG: 1-aminocyclopropane-1-carboxylate deaminase [Methylomonas sp.]PPD36610.1 MAG: 1-aminocyclopropane-1-carboxylate deaminase [Methylomonas sp.]PPD39921.1 MAG: 1-aminocyclopropane-1-carboxylate deaminase [Methylomonas sp.]